MVKSSRSTPPPYGVPAVPHTKETALNTIRSRRLSNGLSVNAAAKASTISQAAWRRVEAGTMAPSWDTLFAMAAAVGLDPVWSFAGVK